MKHDTNLPLSRFLDLLAAYGGDLERWPSAERARARALVAGSVEARRALDAERPLDAIFEAANAGPSALDPDFERRLLAIPSQVRRPFGAGSQNWLRPALGLAAAAALGFALGNYSDAFDAETEAAEITDAGAPDEELFVALALGDSADWEDPP